MLAIDSFLVIFDDQSNLVPMLPIDDLSIILSRMNLFDNIAQIIPKIINSIETSTVLNEHSQAEKYLERAFDIIQTMLSSNSNEVKLAFCNEKILKDFFSQIMKKTISDPSPVSLTIIKRFIKIIQAVTQSPQTYKELENYEIVKLLVDLL